MRWWPWGRKKLEARSLGSVPWVPFNIGGTASRRASQDKALGLAPWFAAVRFLADGPATLPLKAYSRDGEDRKSRAMPQLLQFEAEQGTLVDWLTRAVTSLAIHGNALGLILERDGFGFPTRVEWRPRHEFHVNDDRPVRPEWHYQGRVIDRSQIVHIPWLTVPGMTMGLSPIEYAALTINSGLGAQEYGTGWFDNGGVPPGTFKNSSESIDQDQADLIKARLGRAIATRQPLVYGMEWEFNPIAIPPEQAQFVQTQNLTANQVAAIFGIAPEEVGGVPSNSLTYNTEELRQTRRVSDWRPWFIRLETGISALLPERQFVKFEADAVIRADLKSRFAVYKTAREMGLMSVNEIRALEDMPPIAGGDEYAPLKAIESGTTSEDDGDGATVTPLSAAS